MDDDEDGVILGEGDHGKDSAKIRAAVVTQAIDEASSARLGASPSSPTESIPLSHAQRALWLHHASAPDSSVYNSSVAFRGCFDPSALRAALDSLVERHPMLRLRICVEGGEPVQRVLSSTVAVLDVVDGRTWDDATLRRRIADAANAPFDLERGPLFRTTMFETGDGRLVVLLLAHHLVADYASIAIVIRDLGRLYAVAGDLRRAGLPPAPDPFAAFAERRAAIERKDREVMGAYWRDRLLGVEPLELPVDRPRRTRPSYRGGSVAIPIGAELSQSLNEFAHANGTTLYTVLLATFQALLFRITGQQDLVVGSPRSWRTATSKDTIGYFVDLLPMRGRVDGELPFNAWLGRVRAAAFGALRHDYPFVLIAEDFVHGQDVAPLNFQTAFTLQQARSDEHGNGSLQLVTEGESARYFGDAEAELVEVETRTSPFDLSLTIEATDGGLAALLQYASDLFDADMPTRILAQFRTLLSSVVAAPDTAVRALAICEPEEREWLLARRGPQTRVEDRRVHEHIEAIAARSPEALAVSDARGLLTYAELNARANQLARQLLKAHGGDGAAEFTVVVVCDGAIGDVVAMLAIAKAGGTSLPIDPAVPDPRMLYLLGDSGARVVIAAGHHHQRITGLADVAFLSLDDEAAHPVAPDDLGISVDGRRLAYIVYTSGSTGQPKGVEVEHASLENLVAWHLGAFELAAVDRATRIAGPAFDASIWELWSALVAGASVHFPPPDTKNDPQALRDWLVARDITVSFAPTPLAEALLDVEWPRETRLRLLLTGGDVLRKWPRTTLPFRVINNYGPTECTVVTTSGVVPARDAQAEDASALPRIGSPIGNAEVYVLDAGGQPVPVGMVGELFVGGPLVARGYRGRDQETAERFVRHPFSPLPCARLYRTGDLVRLCPNGELAFVGRQDEQVKVRGFRIELSEVEAHLQAAPGVVSAAVAARPDARGEPCLVGHVVVGGGWVFDPAALRAHLQRHLPAFMVPSAWIEFEALPLTPNGKLDRRALLRYSLPKSAVGTTGNAPSTTSEELLAEIWQGVLATTSVGQDDDFFALGGHSLLAAQVVVRVRTTFGVDLPLRALFDHPTLAALAARIERLRSGATGPGSAAIERRDRTVPAPLTFGQQRLWFVDMLDPGRPTYNIAAVIRIRGPLDVAGMGRAIDQLVHRHAPLRTAYELVIDAPVQRVRPHVVRELEVTDHSDLPAESIEKFIGDEARALGRLPFVLGEGDLFRARLLLFGAHDHALLVATHHIAFDGSHQIFLRELQALYAGDASSTQPPSAALDYADFAAWQRHRRDDAFADDLVYWKSRLGGELPTLDFSTDRPRPLVLSSRGARETFRLPATLSAALAHLARQEGVTLFMVLLAAFDVLLARHANQEDILVGSPVADRPTIETESLIGCFINTVVLRSDLSGRPTFRTLLARVRDVVLEADAHKNVPFERVVEAIQPVRSLNRSPLFQVMFTAPSAPEHFELRGGATAELQDVDLESSRFELLLSVVTGEKELRGTFEYNTDLFDASTIQALAKRFEVLLAGVVADPTRCIDDIPMLDDAQRSQLVERWNDTDAPCDTDRCMHELFEARAAADPKAIAVVDGHRTLRYGELDSDANRLAHHLRDCGVTRGSPVAVFLGRRIEMITTVLAIHKAGGFYVPISTDLPQARVCALLEQTQIRCVVSETAQLAVLASLSDRVPSLRNIVLCDASVETTQELAGCVLVTSAASFADCSCDAPPKSVGPDDLAYMIFTSGSTGTPKGVVVRHRPAINLIEWVNRTFAVGPSDRLLFVTSLSFDLSVYDLFGALAAGASIRVAHDHELRDPQQLARILADEPITFWDSAPAMLQQLAPYWTTSYSHARLRLVFLSGDWIPVPLPDAVRQAFPQAKVVSLGGATEAVIWSNFYPIGDVNPSWTSIPYGRPIQNARYYILDARQQPVPVGVSGDLYIGGPVLSDGYANDPVLTAQKFVLDPFVSDPTGRMYRTGDRARFWPDGNIEFLGRLDEQVKIRGFRIELGEIETALVGHPDVRSAIVVARAVPSGKMLVAYVEPASGRTVSPAEVRAHLAARLPDYMVPAAVIVLEAIPMTGSGKVDRKALPAPADRLDDDVVAPPSSDLERMLVEIWRDVLGIERVGVRDNFFEVGGHSLLVVQMHRRLRERLGRELAIVDLFENPTIESLARHLAAPASGSRATEALTGRDEREERGQLARSRTQQQLNRRMNRPARTEPAALASAMFEVEGKKHHE